jgi:hypothetical protein
MGTTSYTQAMANKQKIDLKKFIPSNLRNELNTSLADNLFNRFLSEEQSVSVSGQVGKVTDPNDAVIQASDLDRELNALVPALYFKTGAEESLFTFDDLLNRMAALGVDINNLKSSLSEQSLNLAPPIDLDKFINFSNYYWTAVDAKPVRAEQTMAWNTALNAEYYVIKRPSATSNIKLPVNLATTNDIKLYGKGREPEKVTVEFQSNDTFTITGSNGPLSVDKNQLTGIKTLLTVTGPNSLALFSFQITQGSEAFEVGDKFEIDITYVTGSNTVSFTPGPSLITLSKGFVSNIVADSQLMMVDGVRVKVGDTVLVKNQTNAAENGVYVVKMDKWLRLSNYSDASHFPASTSIYVYFGSQAGKTFTLQSTVTEVGVSPIVFAPDTTNPAIAVNDWQIYNFWVHKDDLDPTYTNATQATRPIIEYDNDLQLNAAFDDDGYPTIGSSAPQSKTRFNQIPQFDLFYYDGHHAKKTSGIFFYEEDPDFDVDAILLRRTKLTVNADYMFGLGVKDEDGRLLFFKKQGELKSIWAPGNTTASVTSLTLNAEASEMKGSISTQVFSSADTQTWTITAKSATTFSVVGSRSGYQGDAIIGVAFTAPDDFEIVINEGSVEYAVGDTFTMNVAGVVAPRYVKKVDGNVVNVVGGPLGDTAQEGSWMVPRRMFENMLRTLSTEIAYGDLVDHCRSIIKSQDGFKGSSFGINNYRQLSHNHGLGGNIREYNGNFPLLASLLMQPGMSPLSIIDFGEQQYATALASIDQFLSNELANYIATTAVPSLSLIDPTDAQVQNLLNTFENLRANDQLLKDVFSDSTALVKNWPVTLPMMGITRKTKPTITFDMDLGIDVIVHHDNHRSPLAATDVEFDRNLARTLVRRSDSTTSAGVFAEAMPNLPYARQLWFRPSTNELKVFDVFADTDEAPASGVDGQFWYKRSANELREWDSLSNTWVISASTIASRWTILNSAAIRNSLVLAVEQKLADSVHPSMTPRVALSSYDLDDMAAVELARFSAKYGYDTYATVFDQSDAFTWNYSMMFGDARWFDVYATYFYNEVGVVDLKRPNIEPWKLLGLTDKPSDWDAKNAGVDRLWKTEMWLDIMAAKPGLKLCVDINTDALLPPYVSSSLPESQYALTTVKPEGIANTYSFQDNGPVENIWRKSLEYGYSLARIYFKRQPLRFVENLWGTTYIYPSSNALRLERNLSQPSSPSKFLLHGERLHNIVERDASEHFIGKVRMSSTATANVEFQVTHTDNNKTYFYAYINGALKMIVEEGKVFSLSGDGVIINDVIIDDMGIPFSLGDKFTIKYTATPDPAVDPAPPVDPEDCGCVVPGTNDTLPYPQVVVTSVWTFTPAKTKKYNGVGQLYTNLLRYNYIDTDMSKATNAYRSWDVRLVHRLGALIRGDSLEIDTALGTLPETAYNLLLKRSEYLDSKWISALRIQLVQAGKRVATSAGNYIPVGAGEDWVFRLETYNPQHPLIEYYSYEQDEYLTFNALQGQTTKLEWKHRTKRAHLNQVTTPIAITGVQNLIDVIFGYIERLEEVGFKINMTEDVVVDAETGRNLDWQLEVEKLVDRIYTNMGPGNGHVLNPFLHALYVETPTGLLSRYTESSFIDTTAAQAIFDVTGKVIPMNNLYVVRTDDSAVTYSDVPIFSAHVFNDEFEHVIVFNTRLSDEIGSSTIFDPFLGMRIDTARLAYTRQAEVDRKPRFHGFVLNGNDVRRNIVSSVDSIANYYDASKTFNEPATAKHALSLLGFSSKQYFADIGISDATQFNFWRGLIQAKGTNMSIDAFVNYKKFADASVDEYWAYKVADYGDARPRNLPEIKIEQADCQQSFTQLQFYDATTDHDQLPQFIQIEKEDDARWFSIDDLGVGMVFDALPTSVTVTAANVGYYQLNTIFHNGDDGAPTVTKNGLATNDATMVNASLLKVNVAGTYVVNGYTWANPVKQSPVKLFDYKTNTLVKQIALWHPAIGIHAHEPLEIINTVSKADPALYNYSTQTTNNPNLSTLRPWGKKEVGRVWWDTDNLGYVSYYDAQVYPNRNERNARWGSLAEWATIDLCEWTESTVPPTEYDALASAQQGSSEIPAEQRASGKAAKKSYYKRDREITVRPIAWSKAGVGDQAAHPAFGPAVATKVYYAGGALFADAGRTLTINLVEDRHFGAWLNNKPVGEVVITDQIVYDLGSSTSLATPQVDGLGISLIVGGRFGDRIGQINLNARTAPNGVEYLTMSDDFNFSQEIELPAFNGVAGDQREIRFDDFSIILTVDALAIASQIANAWSDVYVREGVRVEEIIALPDYVFVNDPTDADYLSHDYEWKAWDVPSQEDLSSDLMPPRSTWMPYVGAPVSIVPTAAVVKAMGEANLTLKSGIEITRYNSTWTDWVKLETAKVEKISDGENKVSFDRSFTDEAEVDVNRLSIYANGVQLNPQTYIVSGGVGQEVVEIVNILPEGTPVLLIYRAYQPTAAELEFDPAVKDDAAVLTQYKADYQYTKVDVRNEAGVIVGAKYYFWVQDKTVVQPNKSMSLVQAKSILTNGPSQFMMFARLTDGNFDSCVIAGLNNLVTNNDTYKLRFQRNHTLRDDPEQLSLKNTHTEWALIRRSQSSKIPKTLWDHLANAAAAHDAVGNPLPSKSRIDYDERNGTRTQFGFKQGQIFADTNLVRASIVNTILNTSLSIKLGNTSIPDYITALNFDKSDEWFADDDAARATMDLIWSTARPRQINEIFFEVLEDALASNYEFSDIFKTSLISVYSTTKVEEQVEGEIEDGKF